jgi:hypothetical protein
LKVGVAELMDNLEGKGKKSCIASSILKQRLNKHSLRRNESKSSTLLRMEVDDVNIEVQSAEIGVTLRLFTLRLFDLKAVDNGFNLECQIVSSKQS